VVRFPFDQVKNGILTIISRMGTLEVYVTHRNIPATGPPAVCGSCTKGSVSPPHIYSFESVSMDDWNICYYLKRMTHRIFHRKPPRHINNYNQESRPSTHSSLIHSYSKYGSEELPGFVSSIILQNACYSAAEYYQPHFRT